MKKKSVKLIKNYREDNLRDIFVPEKSSGGFDPGVDITKRLSAAERSVYIALGDGMTLEMIAKTLIGLGREVLQLILLPKIEEKKLEPFRGRAIIKEVHTLKEKGSWCVIDDREALLFDSSGRGTRLESESAASALKELFSKEFFEYATEEYIESVTPSTERTFDVPQPFGNDEVVVDIAFNGDSPLEKLIKSASVTAYSRSLPTQTVGDVVLTKSALSPEALKSLSGKEVFLYDGLPFCYAVSDGSAYAMSFDLAKYDTLPERGQGRLFAVRLGGDKLAECYRLQRHKSIGELVGRRVILSDGREADVLEAAKEERTLLLDLREAAELIQAEGDAELLEALLNKKRKGITDTDILAAEISFNIRFEPKRRTMNDKAKVYKEYEDARSDYLKKLKEADKLAQELGDDKAKAGLLSLDAEGKFTDRAGYMRATEALNAIIEKMTGEDALGELLGGKNKKKKTLATLKPKQLRMDLPRYGTLYEKGNEYEYLLDKESNLSLAIEEMERAGIKDVTYPEA